MFLNTHNFFFLECMSNGLFYGNFYYYTQFSDLIHYQLCQAVLFKKNNCKQLKIAYACKLF